MNTRSAVAAALVILAVGAVVALFLPVRPAPEEASAPLGATGGTAPPDGSRRTPPLPGEKPGGTGPAAPEPPPTRSGAGPAVLAGFVLDAETGAPVPRARVHLGREDEHLEAVTDATGAFRVESRIGGRFHVRAGADGYVDSDFFHQASKEGFELTKCDFNVERESADLTLEIVLKRTSMFRARILTPEGNPVPGTMLKSARRRLVVKTKFPFHWTWQTLRRSYGSILVSRGVPLEYISKFLGHSDVRVTQTWYVSLGPGDFAA